MGFDKSRFIEGLARGQVLLLPECLDDYVEDDNPVRVIDALIEMLDLGARQIATEAGWDTGKIAKSDNKSIVVTVGMETTYFCAFHHHMQGTSELN